MGVTHRMGVTIPLELGHGIHGAICRGSAWRSTVVEDHPLRPRQLTTFGIPRPRASRLAPLGVRRGGRGFRRRNVMTGSTTQAGVGFRPPLRSASLWLRFPDAQRHVNGGPHAFRECITGNDVWGWAVGISGLGLRDPLARTGQAGARFGFEIVSASVAVHRLPPCRPLIVRVCNGDRPWGLDCTPSKRAPTT